PRSPCRYRGPRGEDAPQGLPIAPAVRVVPAMPERPVTAASEDIESSHRHRGGRRVRGQNAAEASPSEPAAVVPAMPERVVATPRFPSVPIAAVIPLMNQAAIVAAGKDIEPA